MPFRAGLKNLTAFSMAGVMLALLFFTLGQRPATLAQGNLRYVRQVRVLENDQMGLQHPAGLAFSPGANAFHVVEAGGPGQAAPPDTEFVKVAAYEERLGSARIAAAIKDPNNLAFDGYADRLLILQPAAKQLIEVLEGPDGDLDPKTLVRHDARHFGLEDPRGMAVDPDSGHLFILDGVGPRIVRVEPDASGGFAGAAVSESDLGSTGLEELQGLAFDPTSGHLHVVSLADQGLYELSQAGQVMAVRDLSGFEVGSPQSMVFASSGDLTDDPMQMNLYLADGQQIVELSFVQVAAPAVAGFTSALVQTINTWQWSPPSPDASGVIYLPASDTLLISDGEVNEMPIYNGINVFESTLSGNLIPSGSFTTLDFGNDEPTGITVNPANGHLFISRDTLPREVYEIDPGPDGQYDTMVDNKITWLVTADFGSTDPEGVTFATGVGVLFIADGLNNEIYQLAPGANGIFDGVPPAGDDQVVNQFDTFNKGMEDPEGVAYNPANGNLYIGGKTRNIGTHNFDTLLEVTTSGNLVQTIDVSAANPNNNNPNQKLSGLAVGPCSNNASATCIYIADRGEDNNSNSSENDGRVYEMTLPNSPPVADDDSDSTDENTAVTIDVAGNDSDPDGNLDPNSANSNCTYVMIGCNGAANGTLKDNGDGSITYTPNLGFNGNDNFVYEICDTELACDTAMVTITVNPPVNDPPSVDAGPDQTITTTTLSASANLDGTVSDDGLPDPPAVVTTTWSMDSGPGTVIFGDTSAEDTTASFSNDGTYVLRLTAGDSELTASDTVIVTIEVNKPVFIPLLVSQ